MNAKELLDAARGFRDEIIGNESAEGMCWFICAPLEGYLRFLGEKAQMVKGTVRGEPHYWIRLENGDVLDPSADQFSIEGNLLPQVYIGKLPKGYREDRRKK